MKVSKRLALGASAVTALGITIPVLADPGHPAGGSLDGLHCTSDTTGQPMDGTIQYSPTTIWPPNHKMQNITINYTDNDNDGGATGEMIGIQATSITDNQTTGGVEAQGSGNTGTDWSLGTPGTASDPGVATTTPQVRSERSGSDGSRIYTITVRCTESGGLENVNPNTNDPTSDTGTATLTVTVPHDQGHR